MIVVTAYISIGVIPILSTSKVICIIGNDNHRIPGRRSSFPSRVELKRDCDERRDGEGPRDCLFFDMEMLFTEKKRNWKFGEQDSRLWYVRINRSIFHRFAYRSTSYSVRTVRCRKE